MKRFFTLTLPNAFKALGRFVKRLFSREANFVPAEEARRRSDICEGCALNFEGRCTACSCVISIKTLLSTEKCPTNKW